ncbi:MAG: HAD hydrolase-like protein, partial [Micromonosporaceae bacterium]|nr:HAD hydrolase-like protein [Micromonosporaceae bacterium]
GRSLTADEFARLDAEFHAAYAAGLTTCALSVGAEAALRGWAGTQSLLSMWFHNQLVPTVSGYGLTRYFARVDGLRHSPGGGHKAPHLAEHLAALGVAGTDCVLIGDSVDDADAAVSVGAQIILYTGGFTDPDRLRATGQPVVDTLADAIALIAVADLESHPSR